MSRVTVGRVSEAVSDFERAVQLDTSHQVEGLRIELHEAQRLLRRSKNSRKDFYKALDVPKDCDAKAIKKAYREKALEWHPDKWATTSEDERVVAENFFKDVTEAYNVLSDPVKRKKYDNNVVDPNNDIVLFGTGAGLPGSAQAGNNVLGYWILKVAGER